MSSGTGTAVDGARVGTSPARVDIRTLGHFAIRCGQRAVELNGRKTRALIGYLMLAEGKRETRDRLVGLLWSESDEARARASLRQAVYEIREAFQGTGFTGVTADRLTVSLDEATIQVDLLAVIEEAKAGRAHPALLESERPIDTLFAEFEAIDPAFNVWLLAKRQTYADRITAHLQDALRAGSQEAERIARALLNLDPTNEEAARALIRARVAVGDSGGALGVYKALWDLLERDYDTEPSKETQDLIAQVKLGAAGPAPVALAPAPAPSQPALATRLIIAIGGFDTSGTSEKHRYLIHGFRQELIANLVRFREWVVRDQAGMGAGASRPAAGPGEYVIDASAFEGTRGVRLLIMLRDARTNDYLWSERVELSIESWFDAQQAVVMRLSAALNVNVSAGRIATARGSARKNLSAYDLWLQAQALGHSFNARAWQAARQMMLEVSERSPDFAPAFFLMAQLNNVAHIALPGVFRDNSMRDEALAFAAEAARLDPMDARGQLCLGWSHIMAGQFEPGLLRHEIALDLNENDPWNQLSSALALAFSGDHTEAEARSKRALELAYEPPPVYWGYCTQIAFQRGDYFAALNYASRVQDTAHFLPWGAAAAAHLGDTRVAEGMMRRFMNLATERWQGTDKATEPLVTRWFLHCFPIREIEVWERLREGMKAAGAPTEGLEYHSCCLIGSLTCTS